MVRVVRVPLYSCLYLCFVTSNTTSKLRIVCYWNVRGLCGPSVRQNALLGGVPTSGFNRSPT